MTSRAKCTVCQHARRYELELELVAGVTLSALGRKYEISRDAVWRHGKAHMTDERRAQLAAGSLDVHKLAEKATQEGLSLLSYLAIVRGQLMERFLTASGADDRYGTAALGGRLLEALRLQGSLSGELQKAGATITNNTLVLGSPILADLETMLLERLRPHPEALKAVFEGLEQLRAGRIGRPAALEHAP